MRLLNVEWQKNRLVKCEMGTRLYKLTAQPTQGDICHTFFGMALVANGQQRLSPRGREARNEVEFNYGDIRAGWVSIVFVDVL